MMKKNFLMALLATAIVSLPSCSNEDDYSEIADNQSQGSSFISIGLSTSNVMSAKGLASPEITAGTADECRVSSVVAIFFNGNTDVSVVTDVKTLSMEQIGNVGTTNTSPISGEAFQVSTQSSHLLLVVNPSSALASVLPGTTYAVVNQTRSTTVENLIGASANYFEMTNASGELLDITGNLKQTALAAESTPAKVLVDRAVAKVNLSINPNYVAESNPGATISYIGWVLNVTNKKYFPMSRRTQTQKNTNTIVYNGNGSYRIDPNYTLIQNDIPANEYNIYSGTSVPAVWNTSTDYVYCLENTQEAAANMAGYSTQVIVKASYCPKSVTDVNPETGAINSVEVTDGSSWIQIGSVQYTWNTLKNWVVYELNTRAKDNDPSSYTTPIYSAVSAFLYANGINLAGLTSTINQATAALEATAVKDQLDTITINWAGQTVGNMKYYKDAISYYAVVIKHDNDDSDAFVNQLGEFGVVRNNLYKLMVNKFMNPGAPSVEIPDPETPNEDLQEYISVEIQINPWTTWTQSIDL